MFFLGIVDVLQYGQLILNGLASVATLVQVGFMAYLMNQITNGAWLLKQARHFCIYFDQMIVKFADKVYGYFTQLAGGTLLTADVIDGLMNRVYILIGLFIFFKLAMVAIKYMINPEQFLDDKLGAQTLVKRTIIGSLIIIMIPFIFDTANRIQEAIISDRVIEKIILPEDAYRELVKTRHPGRDLAMTVFKGFFTWNPSISPESETKVYNSYNKAVGDGGYNDIGLFDRGLINKESGGVYVIDYVPIISTLATGYLLFMLIKYAMEIAFRSFKLVFMRLLSPFVIVNYMLDPSKEDVMKKWVNATISTYLMIFIRVLTVWFAVLISYYLNKGVNGTSLLNEPDALLKTLIILGLFAFLKDLPKIVSEIFGYNLQENETIGGIMNQATGIIKGFAFAKVAQGVTRGARVAGMAGSSLGAAGGFSGGVAEGVNQNNGKFNARTLTGGFSNLNKGASGLSSMMGSTISSSMGSTILSPVAQTANASSQSIVFDERTKYGYSAPKEKGKNEQHGEGEENYSSSPQVSNSSRFDSSMVNNNEVNTNVTEGDSTVHLGDQHAIYQSQQMEENNIQVEKKTNELKTEASNIAPSHETARPTSTIDIENLTSSKKDTFASPYVDKDGLESLLKKPKSSDEEQDLLQ